QVRFEDLISNFPSTGQTGGVRGNIAQSRITIVSGTTPTPVHLNPHINYATAPGPQSEIDQSLAFPLAPAFDAAGTRVTVPFFGSGRIASYLTAELEAGTVTPTRLAVCGGPSGVALDAANNRFYVMCRFENRIYTVTSANNPATWSVAPVSVS